jgi:hypothetical protein
MRKNKPTIALLGVIILAIVTSCNSTEVSKSTNETEQNKTESTEIDTNLFYIKRLFNQSPEYVSKILGVPDGEMEATNDCVYLPNCNYVTYKNGQFEIEYYENKLKSILYYYDDKSLFSDDFARKINFDKNPTGTSHIEFNFKNIPEMETFKIFYSDNKIQRYALMGVKKDYNEILK